MTWPAWFLAAAEPEELSVKRVGGLKKEKKKLTSRTLLFKKKIIRWQSFRKQGSDAFDVQEGRSEEAPASIHCPSAFASCLVGKLQHEAS